MVGLYIHIPYCVRKCKYCDFNSYASATVPDAYIDALTAELKTLGALHDCAFDTMFIGGGTPSLLTMCQAKRLFVGIHTYLHISGDAETTMECNPGTVNGEKLRAYAGLGINRLSLGMQSFQDALLKRIGRIHTADDFISAYDAARNAGFTNINVDLMHGLPGQTQQDYLQDIRRLLVYRPEHISAYSLILEEHTPLFDEAQSHALTLPHADAVADMQDAGAALLAASGYAQYEVSNYAQNGYCCRHNINYWQNGMYVGIGAGAHSAWRLQSGRTAQWTRWENPLNPVAYMQMAGAPLISRPISYIGFYEEAFETVMLGLRMKKGVDLAAFKLRFHQSPQALYPHAVAALAARGWLVIDQTHMHFSGAGFDMQNQALLQFMDAHAF
ncbi:MAG: radical SAM family heme chaperone HemW [Clostridiales bacterium]|nr:radical SAM family heme chaperone HemW [Clostridiales bacterium]